METNQDQMKECKELCWSCRDMCQRTLFTHCLHMGGEHTAEAHVKIMIDCIQICQITADFLTRGSEMHASVCSACADICDRCANSCNAIEGTHMEACAEMCRTCADMCRYVGKRKNAD